MAQVFRPNRRNGPESRGYRGVKLLCRSLIGGKIAGSFVLFAVCLSRLDRGPPQLQSVHCGGGQERQALNRKGRGEQVQFDDPSGIARE